MLYHILYPLSQSFSAFNLFRYITFRSVIAFLLAAFVSIVWGKYFIGFMRKKQFGQVVRDDGPQSHLKKAGTPTMGGVVIIGSILAAILVSGNFFSAPILITLAVLLSYFLLGFLDDYLKVLKKNSDGVSAKGKLLWQFGTAVLATYAMLYFDVIDTKIYLPFFKDAVLDIGWGYLVFGPFVIVGSSNAVNLTDGLDGLAIGPIMTSAASLGILTYVSGHVEMANYLFIPYVEGSGELTVLALSVIGAGVGFLWYNSYPAQIFMGDVGSLSLGGLLGTIAVISKNEFLFVLIGGIFVIEALSVILQVGSFKLRGKRVFKMAPIHHHFELKGWKEPKVIVRFWIISIFLALLSVATLKMR
ncbi:MAG: phospho-N-acetylmuramoyl-pentapeptide-transferase [Halobacteriovoraceae bacterium]|nr:phospho-N-acetylmuramoyl-pentapeptide-transferase [Halobacteriovoraceae bacterium]MBC96295.1 phospho-N-acetylmuramoyl-pentapeptide-transferase [Halobacteriovoraceae bacterium]|tara:strand:+ start:21916 stop:22992 length:1077 start_codon:yes stop_codon:yes gene_type:complete